jgi:hypothetical protein
MTAYLLTNHLLNFVAPAVAVAVLLLLLASAFSGLFKRKRSSSHGWWAQAAIISGVNLIVLATGLAVFGADAKIATYAAMVFGAALCHWFLGKGWKG